MSRVYKNILYNLFGQGAILVLSFVSVKYIFHQLGEDALGIIFFTAMMNALVCSVLEMGICATTVREVSAHADTDPGYIHDLVRTFSFFYWAAFLALGVGLYFLAPVLVTNWVNLKTMDAPTATYILRVLGIASLLALPKMYYLSLLRGLQRMEFNNFIEVGTSGMQQFGTIIILAWGGSLFDVVHWIAASYLLGILVFIIISGGFFSLKSIIPGYSWAVVKKNLDFALKMSFITITGAILVYTDKLIISRLLPIGIFGYYSFAYGTVARANFITSAISTAAYPSLSQSFTRGENNSLKSQYIKLHELICFGIVIVFAAIAFAAQPLYSILLNDEANKILFLPTIIICLGFYINGTLAIPYNLCLAMGKPQILARQRVLDMLITTPLTIVLVYFWGLVGASLSVVLCYSLYYTYAIPRFCLECLQSSVWSWYGKVFKIFLLVALTFGLSLSLLVYFQADSILYLALGYVVASIAFLIGAYFMISEELRSSVVGFLLPSRQVALKESQI